MGLMGALSKWEEIRAYVHLFKRKAALSAVVVVLTLLGMLTDSLSLLTLLPLLEVLIGGGTSSAISAKILALWETTGLRPGLTGILIAVLCLMTLRAIIRIAKDWYTSRLRAELIDNLRSEALAALMGAEWSWLEQNKNTDRTNLLLTEVQRAGTGVHAALSVLAVSAAIAAYIITAISIEPVTTAISAFFGGLMLFLFKGVGRRATVLGAEQVRSNQRIHAYALESIGYLKQVKILGNMEQHLTRWDKAITALRNNQIRFVLISSISRELFQLCGGILLAMYVALGVHIWGVPLPELLVMAVVFARLVPLLTSFQQFLFMMANALPALQEAEKIIFAAREAAEPELATNLVTMPLVKELNFNCVSFCFPESEVSALTDITLHLSAGSTTVITGASGAGKSTLADLLMGLLKPDRGQILIDGIELVESDRMRWRHSVSYVPQDISLYAGTVRENLIRAKPSATQAELNAALSAASADFVNDLPSGIDTIIGDGAYGLSGGEKQRIALARGLLRAPSLLVLDEVTSSLDTANELKIRASLAKLSGKITIVILGHRSVFFDIADQVLHLRGGKLVNEI